MPQDKDLKVGSLVNDTLQIHKPFLHINEYGLIMFMPAGFYKNTADRYFISKTDVNFNGYWEPRLFLTYFKPKGRPTSFVNDFLAGCILSYCKGF